MSQTTDSSEPVAIAVPYARTGSVPPAQSAANPAAATARRTTRLAVARGARPSAIAMPATVSALRSAAAHTASGRTGARLPPPRTTRTSQPASAAEASSGPVVNRLSTTADRTRPSSGASARVRTR
ncbi:hypothetical protein FB00_16135 [Cellulosimicrobium funkei]|uniref:Uncharacterized protein n=1 Tax=Cellulosimicrobium funkei TaxID=264251 RepID=A0A0H2L0L9_9MICO|nr:hypothetical protein FB00_16135 [Cellulosimicrobium funkei]